MARVDGLGRMAAGIFTRPGDSPAAAYFRALSRSALSGHVPPSGAALDLDLEDLSHLLVERPTDEDDIEEAY